MKKLVLMFCAVTGFLACSRDEVVKDKISPEANLGAVEVKLIDGMLRFESREHVKNVTIKLGASNNLEGWYPGFTSLLSRQKQILKNEMDEIKNEKDFVKISDVFYVRGSGDESSIEKIVDDPRFAAVLNPKSLIMIGDTVFYVGLGKVLWMRTNEIKSNMVAFLDKPEASLVAHRIAVSTAEKANARVLGSTIVPYSVSGYSERRFVAEFQDNNYVFYESLVIKVKHQRKDWNGWKLHPGVAMSFTASGSFSEWSVPFNFSTSASGTNVEEIYRFVDEGSNGPGLSWMYTNGYFSATQDFNSGYILNKFFSF